MKLCKGMCKDDIYTVVKGFDTWDHGLLGNAKTS
jgi:hypothetical protein